MLNIDVYKKEDGYDKVVVSTDSGSFQISYENNYDLYWCYLPSKSILDENDTIDFTITKENCYLYDAFNNLYASIKNDMPWYNYPYEIENRTDKVSKHKSAKSLELYKDGVIEWKSDDDMDEYASSISIKKERDKFNVQFKKSKCNPESPFFITYAVRFRNSGSKYEPFNIPFMNMYNKLCSYDYQMTIDDYMYQMSHDKGVSLKKKNRRKYEQNLL